MFSPSTKSHSVRYSIENQPQTAWPIDHLAEAIAELEQHGRAVIAVAVAHQLDDVVMEEFLAVKPDTPLVGDIGDRVYRLFQQEVTRKLEEDWTDFVRRSSSEVKGIAEQLKADLEVAADVSLPSSEDLLFRLSWCSEVEWRQYFGLNLLQLVDGSREHPEIAQDQRGNTYLFKYPDQQKWQGYTQQRQAYVIERHTTPTEATGRRMFDLAETLCAQMEQVQQDVSQFMIDKWQKKLPGEVIKPAIVNVTFSLNAAEEVMVVVSLNDENPDNEPLYQYWKVELEDFKPVRLKG